MKNGIYRPGHFVWFELFTDDAAASEAFYEGLLGWQAVTSHLGNHRYRMMTRDGEPVGGVIGLTTKATETVDPLWLPYVSVPNVDEAVIAATLNGGALLAQARDVAGLGRFAVLADPRGAELAVWRSSRGDPPAIGRPELGTFCWTEVNTPDPDGAAFFYQKLLTWQLESHPGSNGTWVFKCGEVEAASMVRASEPPNSQWLCHVLVSDLDQARARVVQLGGDLVVEEVLVPGHGRFAVIRDNVGASLSLFEGEA